MLLQSTASSVQRAAQAAFDEAQLALDDLTAAMAGEEELAPAMNNLALQQSVLDIANARLVLADADLAAVMERLGLSEEPAEMAEEAEMPAEMAEEAEMPAEMAEEAEMPAEMAEEAEMPAEMAEEAEMPVEEMPTL